MYPMEERDTVRKGPLTACAPSSARGGASEPPAKASSQSLKLINTRIVRKLIFDNMLEKLPQAIEVGSEDNMVSLTVPAQTRQ